jgi:transcriptional regulator with XRE-family HTH domain
MTPESYLPDPLRTVPDVGRRLKALRKKIGKTQTEMAACAGLWQESLSRFESGRGVDFSLAKLLKLLDTLGLEIDFKPTTRRPTLNDLLDERRKGNNSGPGAK